MRFTPYKKGGRVKVGISNYSVLKVGNYFSSFLTGSLNPGYQFKLPYDLYKDTYHASRFEKLKKNSSE